MAVSKDESVASVIDLCKKLQVRVHIRGTDDRPVIELRDIVNGRVVGGIELRKRAKRYGVDTKCLLNETSE